ncbi:HEPN domain-containing protein [Brotonthovivens ammoniilytica]|uniref:HEPN domain-containing protein n=1 Tax=Brotonthovivens ammoniilytica TaxID=2981725 RepID=A0ABT2TLS4_9FIRM|nr:HEPN domain-containing protein [Brotonthovivens ammoniilytica]MCU6763164.1 HEPN domain-containing protein [Brotonthovivens ammoniilytica]
MKVELKDLINECTTELTDISAKINTLPPLDKLRAYLTKYALIKSCGTIEFVYRSLVADFFDQSDLTQVPTYIEKTVRNGSMSATYDNMSGLLGKFDDNWKRDFKNAVAQHPNSKRIRSSANSLVNNRHQFAHGKTPTATFKDIQQYYTDALELIVIMDSVVR